MHKKAIKTGLSSQWDDYRKLRNQVTNMLRKARRDYFSSKLEQNRSNPRAFWNVLRQVLRGKADHLRIDKLIVDGNEIKVSKV